MILEKEELLSRFDKPGASLDVYVGLLSALTKY
jgi:hypothetical protein